MDKIDIRKIDMTLLLVFQEIMRHKKLTVVADRLGLTQSSISHALKRLRAIFDDELFIRQQSGVAPTAKAIELQPLIGNIIELTRQALGASTDFVPASARGILRIGVLDNHAVLFAAPLIGSMRKETPGLQASFKLMERNRALQALLQNDIDIALGFFWRLSKGFIGKALFVDGYVVVARKGHPFIRKKVTLTEYLKADHLRISFAGRFHSAVDRVLGEQNLSRTLVAVVPSLGPALTTVARTDLIATVPQRLAKIYANSFGLQVLDLPVKVPDYKVSAVWHERNEHNPMHAWFIEKLSAITEAGQI
jgi:DNA-binding transcriptional LysR family regulator